MPIDDEEPDPRWSLANERTLLAYNRTALAFVVSGLAATGSHGLEDVPGWLVATGFPLLGLGVAVALAGRRRFVAVGEAMRRGDPLPVTSAAQWLPWGIAGVALIAIVLAAVALA